MLRKTTAAAGRAWRGWIVVAALMATAGAACARLSGPVVAVLDGDTVDVLVERRPVRVRLARIDAPEKRQAFGTRAREALAAMVFANRVDVDEAGTDRYGRVLGTVYVAGQDVNAAMVAQGFAWVYRRYAKGARELYELERDARKHKRGLWVDAAPVPPWEFRRSKRARSMPSLGADNKKAP